MLKYFWNPNQTYVIACSNGEVYQMMSDGSIKITNQGFELLEDDIEVTKFQACRKLEESLSKSYDREIKELQDEINSLENNKFKSLLRLRKEFSDIDG